MILAAQRTTDGTLVSAGTKVRALWVRSTAVAGTVVLKDGGSGGTVRLTLNTPAAVGVQVVPIPGPGIQFFSDVYLDVADVDGVTLFYDE